MIATLQPGNGKTSYELVTVIMRQADYARLDERRLPMDVQISLALQHYLQLIREGKWLAESANSQVPDGEWKSVRCALSKQLCEQVRGLMGRFDFHTLQAVRLYLL
jgi:hypothetical protein